MKKVSTLLAASCVLAASVSATADSKRYSFENSYEITITNITKGQTFTPIVGTAHTSGIALFELGAPAIDELATIAESGDIAPLASLLASVPDLAGNNVASEGLLEPGSSVTLSLSSSRRFPLLSMASMLIPTNDTFFAIDSVSFPRWGSKTVFAYAYDAGSEPNDELCANMPGPACGGEGASPDAGGEGFVHIASGISGEGDLKASQYDWNGPVAKVEITRVW